MYWMSMDARFSIKVGKTTDMLSRVPMAVHEIDVIDNKTLDRGKEVKVRLVKRRKKRSGGNADKGWRGWSWVS